MTNLVSLLLLMILSQTGSSDKLDPAQFARVLSGLHSPIRDVELISESEYRFVDESDPEQVAKGVQFDKILQANYAYRSDGRAYLDSYEKLTSNNLAMSHRIYALVDNKLETRILAGGEKLSSMSTRIDGGVSSSIDHKVGSPGRFFYFLFWGRFLTDHPDLPGYRCDGWEKVDGHDCLKVSVAETTSVKSIFWIDMNRGGHVLRHEYYVDNSLWFRNDHIILNQFNLPDGVPIWFPVRGEFESFMNIKGPTTKPVFRDVVAVVNGSLVFNQGLADARFSVDWDGKKTSGGAYSALRKDFGEMPARKTQPVLQRDALSVQKHQEGKLAEADQTAFQLDSSPSTLGFWNRITFSQMTLSAFGIAALVFAFRLRSRTA